MYRIVNTHYLDPQTAKDLEVTGHFEYADGGQLVYAGRPRGNVNPATITSDNPDWVGNYGWLGNPYTMRNESERAEVIARFKTYFWARVNSDIPFRNSVMRLRGDTVFVCFCHPKPCHTQVIIDWLEAGCPLRQSPKSTTIQAAKALFPVE